MTWVMAVLHVDMTRGTEVVIVAHSTSDELGLIEDCAERLADNLMGQ